MQSKKPGLSGAVQGFEVEAAYFLRLLYSYLASFWLVDPDAEGKFLPSGQFTIHFVGGTAIQLGEVTIRFHGISLEALWPQEVNRLLKETTPLSLTNLSFHDQIHSLTPMSDLQ